jgi:hypothetical protein
VRDAPRDADVLLIADGAIIAQGHVDSLGKAEGDALLVTDDSRASAPFERIDAGQRWAGIARLSPALLFGTIDMIGDWDLALTLVRAAVQKGVRRITVPQDDLLEGRVALVESQEQADLVAQAVTSVGAARGRTRGGIEHLLLAPLARLISPTMMRMQVPAMQVRIAAMALAAIALVPIELQWTLTGFALLLLALLLAETSDRLDELALRPPPMGWLAFVTPGMALVALLLVGGNSQATDLVLLLAIVTVADRWLLTGRARSWMIVTPGSALLLLLLFGCVNMLVMGFRVTMIAIIGSICAIILGRRS